MTNFVFATCERERALGFLKLWYPRGNVMDTKESAKPLLDLVEQDLIRVTDPRCHPLPDGQMGISPGRNYIPEDHREYVAIAEVFILSCKKEAKQ